MLLPSNPFLFPFKFITSLFCNCHCIHICIYLHVPKYNLLRLYHVTFWYIFRADCLVLDWWPTYCCQGNYLSHIAIMLLGKSVQGTVPDWACVKCHWETLWIRLCLLKFVHWSLNSLSSLSFLPSFLPLLFSLFPSLGFWYRDSLCNHLRLSWN